MFDGCVGVVQQTSLGASRRGTGRGCDHFIILAMDVGTSVENENIAVSWM